jgi:hypothetical protein
MSMSSITKKEMLPKLRWRYAQRGKKGKTVLLNELCEQWGYGRKYAIKLLNGAFVKKRKNQKRRGRPARYGKEVLEVLRRLWNEADGPCGKRLVVIKDLWLPHYEKAYGALREEVKEQLKGISAAQIDRLLAPYKIKRGRCWTKPGSILKTQIPIRTDNWDVSQPGFLEADTVAHCGGSLEDGFIWSVTFTDIYSQWTSNRAVWNKGGAGIVKATRCVEASLPFKILGFDSDNGSEFLNKHLIRYFLNRPKPVGFTRSRPYHKNDNAHVEQKNWTHVRHLLGYDRLEEAEMVPLINEIYREIWEPYNNFFMPCMKLIKKERIGSKIKRIYDKPLTPCDRLLESSHISEEVKKKLRLKRTSLNPMELKKLREKKLRKLFALQKAFAKKKAQLQS